MTDKMTGKDLRAWAKGRDLTHTNAAIALGIGRTTFCSYIKRESIYVPRTVRLASIGWDHDSKDVWSVQFTKAKGKLVTIGKILRG